MLKIIDLLNKINVKKVRVTDQARVIFTDLYKIVSKQIILIEEMLATAENENFLESLENQFKI